MRRPKTFHDFPPPAGCRDMHSAGDRAVFGRAAACGAEFAVCFASASREVIETFDRSDPNVFTAAGDSADESPAMSDDFDELVQRVKKRHGVRVKRWRSSMSGCAWCVTYDDGQVIRWIESPYPKSPLSFSIFMHEVGHHVIGFDKYKKRCEEEYHVWQWAVREMRALGVEPDEKVLQRVELSMQYAVDKALRRGIKQLPQGLEQYLPKAA